MNPLAPRTPADRARKHWGEAQRLGRLAVEEAWLCGRALNELKATVRHGDFLPVLAELDIPKRTAQRLMQLAADVKSDKLTFFDSVAAALRALPKPSPTPAARPPPQAPANDDSSETEPGSEPNPLAALEASLDAERGKNEGLAEKLAIVEAQLDPEQLNQIDGLRAQISTLKSQVNAWQSKHADVKRERDYWKRKAKQVAKAA